MKIVVFLPNWIGDVVMATPAMAALRRRFGGAHIAVFGRTTALETLSDLAVADETLERPATGREMTDLYRSVNLLRRGSYDLAVLLPNSFRSALTARFAGIGRIAGYSRDGRGWLLTDKLAPRRDEHGGFEPVSAVDYYLDLVRMLGASASDRHIRLAVGDDDIRAADELLEAADADRNRPIVMLNPGAAFGVSKMWEPRRYAALADALIDRHHAQIVINAAPDERAIAAEVAAEMYSRPLINFADSDNTIALLKGLIHRCDLMITGDTGARHLAAGLGAAVVTIFGSTDPQWARIDYANERIIRLDVPCSPCQEKLCPLPAGPHYHQCMADITVEMVLPAAEELLGAAVPRTKGNDDGNSNGDGLATKDTKDTKNTKKKRTATALPPEVGV